MMYFILIWSLGSLGLISLASSMSKHQKQIFGQELETSKSHLAQMSGWILLVIAFAISINSSSLSNGISYWVGALTFSALTVGLCLSYYSSRIKQFAVILGITTMLSTIFYLI